MCDKKATKYLQQLLDLYSGMLSHLQMEGADKARQKLITWTVAVIKFTFTSHLVPTFIWNQPDTHKP